MPQRNIKGVNNEVLTKPVLFIVLRYKETVRFDGLALQISPRITNSELLYWYPIKQLNIWAPLEPDRAHLFQHYFPFGVNCFAIRRNSFKNYSGMERRTPAIENNVITCSAYFKRISIQIADINLSLIDLCLIRRRSLVN